MDKKKDPSLSVSGVLSIMKYQPSHLVLNTTGVVYVSVCVRTWMTAYLMYGRTCKHLTLIVSPYIKEKDYDPGNMPEKTSIQAMKFNNLLNFVVWLKENELELNPFDCKVSVYLASVDPKTLMFTFSPPDKYVPPLQFSSPESLEKLKSYCIKFLTQYVEKKMFDPKEEFSPKPNAFFERSKPRLLYDPPSHDYTVEMPYSTEMTTFYKDGLLKFYAWVKPDTQPVFVVSHNHQMQDSLKEFLKKDVELAGSINVPDFLDANGWTIKFIGDELLKPEKFIMGIPPTPKKEVDPICEFLCSQDQSVYEELNADPSEPRHPQHSDMGLKFIKSYNPLNWFTSSPEPISSRQSIRGMGGKKKSHRRKKRRTGRRYSMRYRA